MRLYGQLGAPLRIFLLAYSGLPLPLIKVVALRKEKGRRELELAK